jgi:hypothetical protein
MQIYSALGYKTNKSLVIIDKGFTFYTTKKKSTKKRNTKPSPNPPEGGSAFTPVQALD